MILLPPGTKVIYTTASGTKMRGEVIGSYDGDDEMYKNYNLVYLDNDPHPSLLLSTTLEPVEDE